MNIHNNKTDRRVSRTRRQLRDALMALILERGYNAVTIEDITERADLGRTTFYLHFHDKEELLVESLEEIAEDLKAQVEQIAGGKQFANEKQIAGEKEEKPVRTNPVAVVFRHVDENRDLYQIILKGEGSSKVLNRIRDIIEKAATDFFARHMSEFMSAPPEAPKGLVAGYFASAMLGFVTLWLEKGLPFRGDEAADWFMNLFFHGAAQILNLTIEV